MMNEKIFSILQSPDDRTSLSEELVSEKGVKYKKTKSGILILAPQQPLRSDIVYSCTMYKKWESIIADRIKYYTQKDTIAGRIANWSYRSLDYLNKHKEEDIILDIGCGDGAHVRRLKNKKNYIGLDKNLERLEILKSNYPEVTAIYGDAVSLPFKKNSLKYIFSSNAFEHLWYLKDVVLECFRSMMDDGELIIVVPTEGGLWNLGRTLLSKPHFSRKYPELNFDLISRIEHCNEVSQIIRTLEIFFDIKKKYIPTKLPSKYLNVLIELFCKKNRDYQNLILSNSNKDIKS